MQTTTMAAVSAMRWPRRRPSFATARTRCASERTISTGARPSRARPRIRRRSSRRSASLLTVSAPAATSRLRRRLHEQQLQTFRIRQARREPKRSTSHRCRRSPTRPRIRRRPLDSRPSTTTTTTTTARASTTHRPRTRCPTAAIVDAATCPRRQSIRSTWRR